MDLKSRIKWLDNQNEDWCHQDRVVYLDRYSDQLLSRRWQCSTVKNWIGQTCEATPLFYLSYHEARKMFKKESK